MAIPTNGVKMGDLTQETSSTLDGTEQFVMFDSTEGKRATLDDVATAILSQLTFSDPNNDGNIVITIGGGA